MVPPTTAAEEFDSKIRVAIHVAHLTIALSSPKKLTARKKIASCARALASVLQALKRDDKEILLHFLPYRRQSTFEDFITATRELADKAHDICSLPGSSVGRRRRQTQRFFVNHLLDAVDEADGNIPTLNARTERGKPDKLARAFQGDEDGMYGRFLYGWASTPDYRPLTNEVAEIEPELQSALKALIRLPAEDADNVFAPQAIQLSQEAVERFEDYRRHVDKMKRALDGVERQWLVKSESQVLRLAGALTFFPWAFTLGTSGTKGLAMITADLEPHEIGEEFMAAAIRLVRKYFWPHARAALRQIGLTDRHRNARRALRWIAAHG